jgi:hypothetical protein
MPVNHGTASSVPFKAHGSQEVDEHLVDNEMSAADTGSELKGDRKQRGANESYEDEKNLRTDSPATDYTLKWSTYKKLGEGADGGIRAEIGHRAAD